MVLELKEWHAAVLPVLAGLAGASIAAFAFWVRRWPSVPGTIDISIYDTAPDGEGMKFYLSYSYTVANRDYAGENVTAPLQANVRSGQLNARRYREKMKVTVYYCPWQPRIACLEHGSMGKSLAFAAVLIAFAVWLFVGLR